MGKKKKADIIHIKNKNDGDDTKALQKEIVALRKLQRETCEMAVRTILHALDLKDHYTYGHSLRVAFYSLLTGQEMGLSPNELYDLEIAALFHDIGKIGVPDSILLKPARLDDKEFEIMKGHPEKSAEILEEFVAFVPAALYARHHHERYDGRGYPDQLKGDKIPLFSRILLVTDTFDAMTSTRPYRKGLALEIAFSELREFAGSQFDPKIVDFFIKAMEKDQKKKVETFSLNIIKDKVSKNC